MKKILLISVSVLSILVLANLVALDINWLRTKRVENVDENQLPSSHVTPTPLITPTL